MSRTLLFCLTLLTSLTAHATDQWMVIHTIAPELDADGKLSTTLAKVTRGRVLATGDALVTDESVDETRTALGVTEITLDELSGLIEGVEATHGILVDVASSDTQVAISVTRFDIATEITAIARKTVGKPAVKRTVKKLVTDLLKPPKIRGKKKRGVDAEVAEHDPEKRRVGMTLATLETNAAKELGLKRPSGILVTQVKPGRIAARNLLPNDVILKANKKRVKNPGELAGILFVAAPDTTIVLELWRDGAKTTVELILGDAPEPEPEPEPTPETTPEVKSTTPSAPEAPPAPSRKLGVRVRAVTPELATSLGLMAPTGALVSGVKPGTVGERAGLLVNDVILLINEEPVTHARNLSELVQNTHPRTRIQIEVWRDQKSVELSVTFDAPTTTNP